MVQTASRRTERQGKIRKASRRKKRITANDYYQLFVGEIGIPRHEFLYDIQFWEARRILRGYERRNMLSNQLLRLTAYFSCYAFRENKTGKTPQQWLPLYFDRMEADDDENQTFTQEDIDDMNRDIALFKNLVKKQKKKRTAK